MLILSESSLHLGTGQKEKARTFMWLKYISWLIQDLLLLNSGLDTAEDLMLIVGRLSQIFQGELL